MSLQSPFSLTSLQGFILIDQLFTLLLHISAEFHRIPQFLLCALCLAPLVLVLPLQLPHLSSRTHYHILVLPHLPLQLRDTFFFARHASFEVAALFPRCVELELQVVGLSHGVALLHAGSNRFLIIFFLKDLSLFLAAGGSDFHNNYLSMIKLIAALLLVLIVAGSYSSIQIQEEILGICEQIVEKLAGIQQEIKKETGRMNTILAAGHINTKDRFQSKPEEITQISQEIQKLAREMQKIYDDKNYLQFCILFEEEKQYKDFNTTELQEATNKLNKIITENDDEDL